MDKNLEEYVEKIMETQIHRDGIFAKRWWWPFW